MYMGNLFLWKTAVCQDAGMAIISVPLKLSYTVPVEIQIYTNGILIYIDRRTIR
jgi:hypothetical protein